MDRDLLRLAILEAKSARRQARANRFRQSPTGRPSTWKRRVEPALDDGAERRELAVGETSRRFVHDRMICASSSISGHCNQVILGEMEANRVVFRDVEEA